MTSINNLKKVLSELIINKKWIYTINELKNNNVAYYNIIRHRLIALDYIDKHNNLIKELDIDILLSEIKDWKNVYRVNHLEVYSTKSLIQELRNRHYNITIIE